MKNKLIKILIILLSFICFTYLRHIFASYLLTILNIEKTSENFIYKIVSLPIVDLLVLLMLYIINKEIKKNNFVRLFFLTSLLMPILNELDLLILYVIFNFNSNQICFIHYNDFDILKWYLPILLLVLKISFCIFKKEKGITKSQVKLVFFTIGIFLIINKLILRMFI